MIAADAPGGNDHRLCLQGELAGNGAGTGDAAFHGGWLEDHAAHAVDGSIRRGEGIDAVAEAEFQLAARLRLPRASLERLDDAGAGAPGHMKARHRIAVAHGVIAAAFGPADDREDAMAHGAQPVALFARREGDIGFGPTPRPVILRTIEAGGAHPVLHCQIGAVLDAEPPLFG